MAGFTFRLQSLMNLKEQMESQKELEYGAALRRIEEERQKEQALKNRRLEALSEFAAILETRIDSERIAWYNQFLDVLAGRIKAQGEAVKRAEAAAEAKRLELVEAVRERKTMERLKENDYEVYSEEEKQAEQKEVDVVVSYKYSK